MTSSRLSLSKWRSSSDNRSEVATQAAIQPFVPAPIRGVQKNYIQNGRGNIQYNAETINITEIHNAPRETPRPTALIPYSRDPDFVHRPELEQLPLKADLPGSRIAVVGLGGIGKTQLILEYCHRIREQLPDTWVFWIHASSAARFDEGIRKVVHYVVGREGVKGSEDTFEAAYEWLRAPQNKWLLILDNLDQGEFLFDPPFTHGSAGDSSTSCAEPRWEYLPHCSNGAIIITSRNQEVSSKLVDEACIVHIQPDRHHATSLLERKLAVSFDEPAVSELAEALEHIPLAITQAASYIRRRQPRCTVQDYIHRIKKDDNTKTKLLSTTSNNVRRDIREANNAVLLTWRISFDHISQMRPSATQLLSLMSHFDYQAIPASLLQQPPERADANGKSVTLFTDDVDDDLEEDLLTLQTFSFISTEADGATFKMHRLVQLATLSWLDEQGQRAEWLERSIIRLDDIFPAVEFANWDGCRPLYTHAKLAVDTVLENKGAQERRTSLLYKATQFALEQKYSDDAELLANEAYQVAESLYGSEHKMTMDCLATLASAKRQQYKHDEADNLTADVLHGTRKVMGDEHPSTLASMNNLSVVMVRHKDFSSAEELLREVLAIKNRTLGPQHPSSLTTLVNLAHTVAQQGDREVAEAMFRRALSGMREHPGEDDPQTLACIMPLASLLREQGRFEEAEELYTEVCHTRKRILGDDHIDTVEAELELGITILRREGDPAVDQFF